ncbi:nitroreductase family protein [Clostridium beijerinckii]|uniref:nitroreductase family protein n=1 Tax=Clostridium beijerinckii TaxID=1520 RepID=UPI00098C58BE|nr:nitroreductase family protein [Clostridium beijerinckii]NRT76388.1 hypothetical protein [Clostridium beijerinckii]OOM45206.1 nitroreductase family protein [Clostridium beijerinckii]
MNLDNLIFKKSITEIIKARTSIRSYNGVPLDKTIGDSIIDVINQVKVPFGTNIRVKLINSKDLDLKLGTYGVIKGTSTFIVSSISKSDNALVDLGYSLERAVLYATDLNLGTCWLGGTFNKGQFAEVMALKDNEILPIVIPVGYPSESRRGVDTFVRFMAGSKNRKAWSKLFFDVDFNTPLKELESLEYFIPLQMVRLAPSAANKQPWRIIKSSNSYDFYLEQSKDSKSDSYNDMHKVDIGIAMCHFELTSAELGLEGHWEKLKLSSQDNKKYIISWVRK